MSTNVCNPQELRRITNHVGVTWNGDGYDLGARRCETSAKDKSASVEPVLSNETRRLDCSLQEAGGARNAMTRKASSVCAGPAALVNLKEAA